MSAYEVVAVDDLRVGDRVKVRPRMWWIERIDEYPATRLLTLGTRLASWQTFKKRRTLVYREVMPIGEDAER